MELKSKIKSKLFPPLREVNPENNTKGEAFWKTAIYLAPIGILFSALYYFYFDAPKAASITLFYSGSILSLGLLKKIGVSEKVYMNLGVLIYLGLFVNLCFFTGGSEFYNIWWLTTTPIVAISFLSRRSTIFMTILSLAAVIIFFQPQINPYVINEIKPEDFKLLKVLSISSLTIVFSIITYFSESGRLKIMSEKTEAIKAANRSSNLASLGEMAGGIAHEINNPLMIISGSTMVIEKGLKKEEIDVEKLSKHLQTIKKTTKRAASIIKGLKTLARDGMEDKAENVTINEVLEDILSFMETKFRHSEIILYHDKTNLLFDKPFPLFRVQFSQVVLNLLTNSFDAIEESENKWIKIEMENTNGEFILRISDSGLGIPAEFIDKIFTPFFTTKPVGKGTGLGLPLCYSIMQKCGGELFYDQERKNTSFALKLPIPTQQIPVKKDSAA